MLLHGSKNYSHAGRFSEIPYLKKTIHVTGQRIYRNIQAIDSLQFTAYGYLTATAPTIPKENTNRVLRANDEQSRATSRLLVINCRKNGNPNKNQNQKKYSNVQRS